MASAIAAGLRCGGPGSRAPAWPTVLPAAGNALPLSCRAIGTDCGSTTRNESIVCPLQTFLIELSTGIPGVTGFDIKPPLGTAHTLRRRVAEGVLCPSGAVIICGTAHITVASNLSLRIVRRRIARVQPRIEIEADARESPRLGSEAGVVAVHGATGDSDYTKTHSWGTG